MMILASASPRRKQLMSDFITHDFVIVVPDIDESLSFKNHKEVQDIVKDIAKRKCLKIAEDHPFDIVIAADTVVVINNQIIGKPKDIKEAKTMLKMLSNNTHFVYTGYAISQGDKLVNKYSKSTVLFNKLNDELIDAYIATGSPLDKAGAYGYQDHNDFPLVKKISGSINNVIGFPTEDIRSDLINIFNLKLDI